MLMIIFLSVHEITDLTQDHLRYIARNDRKGHDIINSACMQDVKTTQDIKEHAKLQVRQPMQPLLRPLHADGGRPYRNAARRKASKKKRLLWPSIRQLIGRGPAMESWSEEGRTVQTADSLSRSGGHLYAIERPEVTIL